METTFLNIFNYLQYLLQCVLNDFGLVRKRINKFIAVLQPVILLNLLWRIPILIFYFTYLWIPLIICQLIKTYFIFVVEVCCRRSVPIKNLIFHVEQLANSARNFYKHVRGLTYIEIAKWIVSFLLEVLGFIRPEAPIAESHVDLSYAEMVSYEEGDEKEYWTNVNKRRMKTRIMHYNIPANSFSVTLRCYGSGSTRNRTKSYEQDVLRCGEQITPESFPTSPCSRATVLSRASDRTENILYNARDILRLEKQAESENQYSRDCASILLDSGIIVSFDKNQTAKGLYFTSGSHCVFKPVLKNPVSAYESQWLSSRATISLPLCYSIYMEYEIIAAAVENPRVAFGFASSDFSLCGMVGKASSSISMLSTTGSLITGKSFQSNSYGEFLPTSNVALCAGDVVGILISVDVNNDLLSTSSNSICNNLSDDSEEILTAVQENIYIHNIQFNVNGRLLKYSRVSTLEAKSLAFSNIFPVVSIESPGTTIKCSYSSEDCHTVNRASMGASDGQTVYCLDGSILLNAL